MDQFFGRSWGPRKVEFSGEGHLAMHWQRDERTGVAETEWMSTDNNEREKAAVDLQGDESTGLAETENMSTAGKKELAVRKAQTESDLNEHQTSRADAKESMATATALRVKEPATYEEKKAHSDANIAALGKAMAAIESGMACSFIQTPGTALGKNEKFLLELEKGCNKKTQEREKDKKPEQRSWLPWQVLVKLMWVN